ncbi:MAG: manganese efflux pump MntP family protein [Candidatus Glassbacteria bacterium]
MSLTNVMFLAVGLAMDALAVSVGLSLKFRWNSFRQFFRLSFHFGLFQFIMPVVGWAAGERLGWLVAGYDHWAVFVILSYIGYKMIRGEADGGRSMFSVADPTRGRMLVLLSVATSLDALGVGLSLSLLAVSIWFPSIVIGIVACLFTLAGMYFGNRFSRFNSRYLSVTGGLVLIGIGAKILFQDLFP